MSSEPLRLTLDSLVPYLLESGLVSREDVLDRGIQAEDRSRRNRNFKVLVGSRRGLLVKQAGLLEDPEHRASFHSEACFLAAASTTTDLRPLRWAVPRLVRADGDHLILATRLVHPATSLTKFHLNGGKVHFPPEAARTVALILAQTHSLGRGTTMPEALENIPRRPPPVWDLLDGNYGAAAGSGLPAFAALRQLIRGQDAFWGRLADLRAAAHAQDRIVHGDVRWDNILLTHGEAPHGGLNLRLIDWEWVGRGDPAWDVACALAEYLRFWLATGSLYDVQGLEGVRERAAFPVEQFAPAVAALWESYAGAMRLSGNESEDLAQRVARSLPFVLVMVAHEQLQGADALNGPARAAFELATELAWRPGATFGMLAEVGGN